MFLLPASKLNAKLEVAILTETLMVAAFPQAINPFKPSGHYIYHMF
jgi:hypothetical protein